MPNIKPIRRFTKPQVGAKGLEGRYIIRLSDPDPPDSFRSNATSVSGHDKTPTPRNAKTPTGGTSDKDNYNQESMRLVNLEFDRDAGKGGGITTRDHASVAPPVTSSLTFSDFLCKWCLAYVGQRRQFCSADCASQFKICQRRREQRQDLNISVDYYGNVKLSIQGLPLQSGEEGSIPVQKSLYTGYGGGRRVRRRKRCRNCAKLLRDDTGHDGDFCDDTCQSMDTERTKKEDFVNIFQQKEAAERRRIRKWLMDAQDNYSKQQGEQDSHGDPDGYNVMSGPAALDPLPVVRTPIIIPDYTKPVKDSPTRSGGPSYGHTRSHYVQDHTTLKKNEMITGGPVTLNPTPRRGAVPVRSGPEHRQEPRHEQHRQEHSRPRNIASNRLTHSFDSSDKRQVMIDLNWIPKFHGQQ